MTLAGRVRHAYGDWTSRHTGWMIDGLILRFYSAKDAPPNEVIVVVGGDSDLDVESELRAMRAKIQRIARSALDEPVSIVVRTRDSRIIVGKKPGSSIAG